MFKWSVMVSVAVDIRVVLLKAIIIIGFWVIWMTRRVRTDFESRDFHCPCSRSYLSYSALHTHIKKYHKKEDNMLERATIPQRAQHRRGRPKDKQQAYISEELEDLTHFETAILGIYQELLPITDAPILLEGNQEFDIQAYNQEY